MALKKTLVLNATQINHFLFVPGILTVLSYTIILKYLFWELISLHNFDVVCISETYLDSATTIDDKNLEIARYNLLRADHASSSKRGSVCVYYKSSLAFRLIDVHSLQECLIFEILIGGKLCNLISLYRSPSQSSNFFEELQTIYNSH